MSFSPRFDRKIPSLTKKTQPFCDCVFLISNRDLFFDLQFVEFIDEFTDKIRGGGKHFFSPLDGSGGGIIVATQSAGGGVFEGSGNQEGSESIEELPSGSADDIRYWKIGDRISREIDGKFFAFRCIDQNYYGAEDSGQAGALFLCDQVIPWDYGSCSAYEKLEDGSYGYVYHKGPIEAFGRNEEYKYSVVREYLGQVAEEWEEQGYQMKNVRTGRTYTYIGQTKERSFEQFSEQDLTAHPSSYQQMTDRVFLLSVEEAIRYRDELWKFSGMDWLRPASTRYWLRTAMGREGGEGTGQAYAVDLVKGCIAPVDVGDTCGIRPAFVVTQAASR